LDYSYYKIDTNLNINELILYYTVVTYHRIVASLLSYHMPDVSIQTDDIFINSVTLTEFLKNKMSLDNNNNYGI
jgi:hypothetical protein